MTAEASQAGAFDGPAADGERPLRIALLTYKGNPFCGGQGVYVRHLSRELARLGHHVEVIGSQPYPVLDPGYDGLSLTELPSLDLYRSPDPFRTPKRDEYRDWIDALEVATMWTGGFPSRSPSPCGPDVISGPAAVSSTWSTTTRPSATACWAMSALRW